LLAYELGYRWQAARRVSVDLAAFYNRYQHLKTQESGAPFFEQNPAPPHLVLPTYFGNQMDGHTHGVEVSTQWRLTGWWKWDADYAWLRLDLRQRAGSRALDVPRLEGSSPKHQLHLHSYLDLPGRLQFDTGFYYVDRLAAFGIPSYLRADVRLGWRPTAKLELSLGAENLLDNRHPEFSEASGGSRTVAEVGRSVYGKITWRFR
jgi:iron complex outermembrane receptor protein